MMFLSEWLSCRVLETPRTGRAFPRGTSGPCRRGEGARARHGRRGARSGDAPSRRVSSAWRVGRSDWATITISSASNVARASAIAWQRIAVADPPLHAHPCLAAAASTQAVTRSSALRRAASSSDSQRCSRESSAGATTSTSAFATWTGVTLSRAMMSTFMVWVPSGLVARAAKDTGNPAYPRHRSHPRSAEYFGRKGVLGGVRAFRPPTRPQPPPARPAARVQRYLWRRRVDEKHPQPGARRSGYRRAGSACRRLARTRSPCGARGAASPRHPSLPDTPRRAGTRGRVRAERRSRGRGAGDPPARIPERRTAQRRHRPRQFILAGAFAAAVVPSGIAFVVGSNNSTTSFHAALAATDLAPGADGAATLTKTSNRTVAVMGTGRMGVGRWPRPSFGAGSTSSCGTATLRNPSVSPRPWTCPWRRRRRKRHRRPTSW